MTCDHARAKMVRQYNAFVHMRCPGCHRNFMTRWADNRGLGQHTQPKGDNMTTWRDKVEAEKARLGRKLTLDELLALAKTHFMTPDEIQAQRESWTRQDKD